MHTHTYTATNLVSKCSFGVIFLKHECVTAEQSPLSVSCAVPNDNGTSLKGRYHPTHCNPRCSHQKRHRYEENDNCHASLWTSAEIKTMGPLCFKMHSPLFTKRLHPTQTWTCGILSMLPPSASHSFRISCSRAAKRCLYAVLTVPSLTPACFAIGADGRGSPTRWHAM
jgi:hypothetical protein